MTEMSANLVQRVVSGFLALFVLIAVWYFGKAQGLQFLCTAAVILGTREYSRMAFSHWRLPAPIASFFWLVCALLYAALVLVPDMGLTSFGLANAIFLTGVLWLCRDKVSNENLLAGMAMGCFGILYCVAFPYFIFRTVALDHGSLWFLFLLVVVFFGDIFAYAGGRLWGRRKMMEQVSPKKTWEGSLSGLVGSSVAGVIYGQIYFSHLPFYIILAFCVVCGVASQSGDLLMSLVKRVAQVKDSGRLMPGHGGILDRLDGIFIACPLIYAFALYSGPF